MLSRQIRQIRLLVLRWVAMIVMVVTPPTFEGCPIQHAAIQLNIPFFGKYRWCNLNPFHTHIRPTLWRWRMWAMDTV